MDLKEILHRFSKGIEFVDANTKTITTGNRKRDRATNEWMPGKTFLPGVKTMKEPTLVSEVMEWWKENHGDDFESIETVKLGVDYPNLPSGNKCDFVFTSKGFSDKTNEWAVEVKHISFCGDNGIKNDHGVQKVLSPYRKDRALIHDMERLRSSGLSQRKAVIGYCFNYSFESCERARQKHPNEYSRIENLLNTCKENDPEKGILNIDPLIKFANRVFTSMTVAKELVTVEFKDAWRHPCGGDGTVFGWEVI